VGLYRRVRRRAHGKADQELEDLRANLVASGGVEADLHEDRKVSRLTVEGLDTDGVGERVSQELERVGIYYGGQRQNGRPCREAAREG
jgi:hypothetical protein